MDCEKVTLFEDNGIWFIISLCLFKFNCNNFIYFKYKYDTYFIM